MLVIDIPLPNKYITSKFTSYMVERTLHDIALRPLAGLFLKSPLAIPFKGNFATLRL